MRLQQNVPLDIFSMNELLAKKGILKLTTGIWEQVLEKKSPTKLYEGEMSFTKIIAKSKVLGRNVCNQAFSRKNPTIVNSKK